MTSTTLDLTTSTVKGGKKRKCFTLFDHHPKDALNLQVGSPSEPLLRLAADMMKKASVHRMSRPDSRCLFQYGPEVGDRSFLEALATLLSEEYSALVDVEDLIVTAGATQGLFLLCNLLFSSTDLVFVENPTYFVATKIIGTDARMTMVPVPMDEHGIIPDELEKALEAKKGHKVRQLTHRQPYWGILYLIPTFHNPTGICLPADRCRCVVEIARKYNLLVVCDDVYNLLYFGDKPPHRLFQFDNKSDPDYKGNVVSNGSFSKIFGPGVRLGWMEVPERLKDIITTSGAVMSGGGFNHCMSGMMDSVISLGLLKEMLQTARPQYQERCKIACDILKSLSPALSFTEPQGGYFLWIKLPDGIIGKEVTDLCAQEYRTIFFAGDASSPIGDCTDHIRISFSYSDKETIKKGAENIVKAVRALQSKMSTVTKD